MTTHEPTSWTYAYLILSVGLFFVWFALYILRRDLHASMLRVSACTALLAITERAFVPSYWNPFTIFNLARRTGFDLESVLFSFAIGGIVFVAYDLLFHVGPVKTIRAERSGFRHRAHTIAIVFPYLVFGILLFTSPLNPIYSSAIALIVGFAATLYCRRDLWLKMIVSGGLFFAIYFLAFIVFNVVFPGYVEAVWNLKAISGVRVMGVPLEEMMFGFTFGLYWSSVYAHLTWHGQRALTPVLVELKKSPT